MTLDRVRIRAAKLPDARQVLNSIASTAGRKYAMRTSLFGTLNGVQFNRALFVPVYDSRRPPRKLMIVLDEETWLCPAMVAGDLASLYRSMRSKLAIDAVMLFELARGEYGVTEELSLPVLIEDVSDMNKIGATTDPNVDTSLETGMLVYWQRWGGELSALEVLPGAAHPYGKCVRLASNVGNYELLPYWVKR